MKKGQTQMIFIFIMATIIIGLIVLLGYKGIKSMMDNSEKVMINDFFIKLEKDTTSIQRLKGTTKVKTYKLPSSVMNVCFVKSCEEKGCVINYGAVPDIIKKVKGKTVYLLDNKGSIINSKKIKHIEIKNQNYDVFCVNNKFKIKIGLEGMGDGVKLSSK